MGQNEIQKIQHGTNPMIHLNKWYWGISETIIIGGGKGVCKVSIENDDLSVAWLSDVSVIPLYRKRGYGNEILQWAIARAQCLGAKTLYLFTDPNDWPIEWYKRHGFVFDYTDDYGNSVLKYDLMNGH